MKDSFNIPEIIFTHDSPQMASDEIQIQNILAITNAMDFTPLPGMNPIFPACGLVIYNEKITSNLTDYMVQIIRINEMERFSDKDIDREKTIGVLEGVHDKPIVLFKKKNAAFNEK